MSDTVTGVTEPRIARAVTLRTSRRPGRPGPDEALDWLAEQILGRTGPGSVVTPRPPGGTPDDVRAVGDGSLDLALVDPAAFATLAADGRGPYAGTPLTSLRALGLVPRKDRVVLALDAALGIDSFPALRAAEPALRIATGADDGSSTVGYAARRVMEAAGIPQQTLEAWGGGYLRADRPVRHFDDVPGAPNAVVQDGVMESTWQDLSQERPLAYLSVEDGALDQLEQNLGLPRATVPAGYLPGQAAPFDTVDFSDLLVLVRDDFPEDLAFLIAWCMVETRQLLEREFVAVPADRSPVTRPLDPPSVATPPIPLHPGAASFYESGLF